MSEQRTVFLSHSTSERRIASAIKEHLERAIPGLDVFTSSVDMEIGQSWIDVIQHALGSAEAILVLCSRESVRRRWLHFEAGAGFGTGKRVIPVCVSGLHTTDLPDPFRGFQAVDLDTPQACAVLVQQLAAQVGLTATVVDYDEMLQAIEEPPATVTGILIDRSHGQDGWNTSKTPSIFEAPKGMPTALAEFAFKPIRDAGFFASPDFEQYRGLILGSPWRRQLDRETVETIRTWVNRGGRLLLLGFELGDFHHGANLNHLARQYGINFNCDIVGPAGYAARGTIRFNGVDMYAKPYGEALTFDCSVAQPHPFTKDLRSVELRNVQTVTVVPGGVEWLRVGANELYRPSPSTVEYDDRTLTQKGLNGCDRVRRSSSMPVAVEAPEGLCGEGAVWAIGTWQLLTDFTASDNVALVRRMLTWLSG